MVTGCPTEDVIAFAQTGSNTVVTWIEPTAVDNSGLEVIIVQNASPGMEFPIGDFSVTYTFTDPAGNAATCQFVVSVVGKSLVSEIFIIMFFMLSLFMQFCDLLLFPPRSSYPPVLVFVINQILIEFAFIGL